MGAGLQHGVHPHIPVLDGIVPPHLPSQPQHILEHRGGHVLMDAVYGLMLELVSRSELIKYLFFNQSELSNVTFQVSILSRVEKIWIV